MTYKKNPQTEVLEDVAEAKILLPEEVEKDVMLEACKKGDSILKARTSQE